LKEERKFERSRPRRCADRRDLRLQSKARVEAAPVPLRPANSTICRGCDGWSLFLRAKPFWRLLAIAGRCTPSRRASTTEPLRSARPQHGAYPCILGVPRMRLTAGWTPQRNRHARKTLEQNPLAAQTR
jgi:hypothetical protein